MEKNENVEIKGLLTERKELANAYAAKKIGEEEFTNKFKELSDKISELNSKKMFDDNIKKSEETNEEENTMEEEIKKRGRPAGIKNKKVIKEIKEAKSIIGINDVMKFLKTQGKPKDNSIVMKKEIMNDLKALIAKIRKM